MTTLQLQVAPHRVQTAPRGARWAANLFTVIYRFFEEVGRRRAEWALKDLIRTAEQTNPALAAELRYMSMRDAKN